MKVYREDVYIYTYSLLRQTGECREAKCAAFALPSMAGVFGFPRQCGFISVQRALAERRPEHL